MNDTVTDNQILWLHHINNAVEIGYVDLSGYSQEELERVRVEKGHYSLPLIGNRNHDIENLLRLNLIEVYKNKYIQNCLQLTSKGYDLIGVPDEKRVYNQINPEILTSWD